MGKYNFDYDRLKKLEERLAVAEQKNQMLEARCAKLTSEVSNLREQSIAPINPDRRELAPYIRKEVMDCLFGFDVDPRSGKIIKASVTRVNINFTNFYRRLMIIFKPIGKNNTGRKNKYMLKFPSLDELSEAEYDTFKRIVTETAELIYSIKQEEASSEGEVI